MAVDLATLALGLTNEPAIAAAKATGAAFEEMGVKGEAAAKKIAASSSPVTVALKRQEVASVAATRGMGTWGALTAEATGHVGEHSLALGRLGYRMESLASETLGLNSAMGLLGGSFLKFGVGDIYAIAIIGGIYAISKAWEMLTEGSKKAREEADKLTKSLVDQAHAIYQATQAGATAIAWAAEQNLADKQKESGFGIGSIVASIVAGHPTMSAGDANARATGLADAAEAVKQAWANVGKIVEEAMTKAEAAAKKTAAEALRDAKEYASAIAQAVAETNKLNIEQARKTIGIETDRQNADLLLAAAKLGTQAYQDQVDAIAVQNRLAQDGIFWFDARYDAAKKSLEVTMAEGRETEAINKANADAATKAKQDAQKAADEAGRPFKNMMRELQSDFARFFDDIFTKGIKSFSDLVSAIKDMFLKMIAEILAANLMKRLAGVLAVMMGAPAVAGAQGTAASVASAGIWNNTTYGPALRAGSAAAGGGFIGYQVGQAIGSPGMGAVGGAASGAAMGFAVGGPVGAVIGGLAGLAGGLLGGAKAAREHAKALQEAQKELSLSFASLRATVKGDTLAQQIAQNSADLQKFLLQINAALPGTKNEADRNQQRAEATALYGQLADKLKVQAAQQAKYAQEDLAVRNLRATGHGTQADLLAFQEQQQREMQAALDSNKDALYINTLKTTLNNELIAFQNGLLSDAVRNNPTGFYGAAAYLGDFANRTSGGGGIEIDHGIIRPPVHRLPSQDNIVPPRQPIILSFQPGSLVMDRNGVMNVVLDKVDQQVASTGSSGGSRASALETMVRR